MKKYFLLILLLFFLTAGVISGIAYERYIHREECLKIAFDNSGVETLSEEEIKEITKTLNSGSEAGYDQNPENNKENNQNSKFVGSKNGNKFYPADCRYAKLIKEENKVFFDSQEEGEKAGRSYIECK